MNEEARQLIAVLAPVAQTMKPSDRRFIESWQHYLVRLGGAAQVNERRLVWLRALASEYTVVVAQERAA